MSARSQSAIVPGDSGWYEQLVTAISRLQRSFQPAQAQAAAFDALLDGYVDLTRADLAVLSEIIVPADGSGPAAVTRCIRSFDRVRDPVTVGDERIDALQALMRRATASAKPCARRIPGPGGTTRSALAVPIATDGQVMAVVGLASDGPDLDVELGAALAPYTLTCTGCVRELHMEARRARARRQLSDSERTMRAVLDNIVDAIVTVDHRGRVETANAAAEHIFGYTPGELVGDSLGKLLAHPLGDEPGDALIAQLASGDGLERGSEMDGRRKDGTVFPMSVATTGIEVSGRRLYVVVARDNTEHRENQLLVERERAANQTLELLIRIDGLTGIANRRHFDEAIDEEGRRAARSGHPLSLIMCDVDCFKAFNDRYGHVAGDKALTTVAREIDAAFHRAGDSAARYGGEEFAVILPSTGYEQALGLAEILRRRIRDLSIPHGASTVDDHVTISVGVATCHPDRHFDTARLVDAADQALYRAKQTGRNRVAG